MEDFPKKTHSEEVAQAEKMMTQGERAATKEREINYETALEEAKKIGLTEEEFKEIVINYTREYDRKIRAGDPEIEFGSEHVRSFRGRIKGHEINADALQNFFGDDEEGASNKEIYEGYFGEKPEEGLRYRVKVDGKEISLADAEKIFDKYFELARLVDIAQTTGQGIRNILDEEERQRELHKDSEDSLKDLL